MPSCPSHRRRSAIEVRPTYDSRTVLPAIDPSPKSVARSSSIEPRVESTGIDRTPESELRVCLPSRAGVCPSITSLDDTRRLMQDGKALYITVQRPISIRYRYSVGLRNFIGSDDMEFTERTAITERSSAHSYPRVGLISLGEVEIDDTTCQRINGIRYRQRVISKHSTR